MNSYKPPRIMVIIQGSSLLKMVLIIISFIFLIFFISGVLTSLKPEFQIKSNSVNTVASKLTGERIYQLLGWENHAFLQSSPQLHSPPKLTNIMFALSTNVNLNDPRSLLGRELPGFSLFDGQILIAGEGTNYTNMPIESSPPIEALTSGKEAALQNTEDIEFTDSKSGISAPKFSTGKRNVVFLYFSHNRESYLPYLKGVQNPNLAQHSKINVTKIGDRLKAELESRGIGTTLDKTDIQAKLNNKGQKYWKSYDESRVVVQAAVSQDRNLSYLIDIHRDSRRKKDTTISIDGKNYAKLAFVIGSKNKNYEKNSKFAIDLHKLLEKKYKGLSRGVIKKGDPGDNGRYNQDLSANAILIEFGGVDNTFEELYRSADALADVFSDYYWQAEKVDKPVSDS